MKNYKSGFTLAEVLITLVIIGVVAALTIPNVIYETKKKEYSSRLKKFYSTMKQVVQKAEADGNSWDEWATSPSAGSLDFQKKYLLPYISYNKVQVVGNIVYTYLNDGSYFYTVRGSCMDFNFDVNGERKPNEAGRDIFAFLYCPNGTPYYQKTGVFIPYTGYAYPTRTNALNLCNDNANNCSALLWLDGWEFKKDYPYRL